MKWMKRSWKSIIRRPIKSLLLLLVVFVMGNLLAGSLSIITTSKTVKEELKNGVRPEATVGVEENAEINWDKDLFDQYNDSVKKLCANKNVIESEYLYSFNGYADLHDLGFPTSRKLDFRLVGTNVAENSYFKDGKKKLTTIVNNRFFSDEEMNDDQIVIMTDYVLKEISDPFGGIVETGLGKLNNEVTLTIPVYRDEFDEKGEHELVEYKVKAKVIGLFNKTEKNDEAIIYVPYRAFLKIYENINEQKKDTLIPMIDYVSFKVDDLETLKLFDDDAKKVVNELPQGFKYESSTEKYSRNSGPIEILDTVAKVILIISIIATVLILGLVIVFFVSERKKEIGLYQSLGEKKRNVAAQISLEIFLISILAISLAGMSGIFVGNKLSKYMLEVQRYVKREQNMGILAKLPVTYKPIKDGLTMQNRDQVIDNYTTKPTAEYFIVLYTTASFTIILSCAFSLVYLNKLEPKEIMI